MPGKCCIPSAQYFEHFFHKQHQIIPQRLTGSYKKNCPCNKSSRKDGGSFEIILLKDESIYDHNYNCSANCNEASGCTVYSQSEQIEAQ